MNVYTNISNTGSVFYYKDKARTILHREDGPAIERYDGDNEWWLNGQRHREDGPAIDVVGGVKAWFFKDKRHRVGGPATEWPDGRNSWYVDGEFIFKVDQNGKVADRMR